MLPPGRGIILSINETSNFLRPSLHTLAIVLHAVVTGGTPVPGDDIDRLTWINPDDELPPMAFSADRYIIKTYFTNPYDGLTVTAP